MFLRELTEPVGRVRGAGPRTIAQLVKAGIHTVADLLCHFPRDWEDRERVVLLAQ
ncbi:MAG: hypothetical protein LBF63_10740, partial [Treponema sp.]|nr:hypothetical protein [Treponema sp.]